MLKRIKSFLLSVGVLSLVAAPFSLATASAAVNISNKLNCGSNIDVSASCNDAPSANGGEKTVNGILTLVINIFSAVVGFVAVIMIIFAGIKYITSGGESSNISGAKNTIVYAVVGLVIVALAQVIVHFVLNRVSGQITAGGGA